MICIMVYRDSKRGVTTAIADCALYRSPAYRPPCEVAALRKVSKRIVLAKLCGPIYFAVGNELQAILSVRLSELARQATNQDRQARRIQVAWRSSCKLALDAGRESRTSAGAPTATASPETDRGPPSSAVVMVIDFLAVTQFDSRAGEAFEQLVRLAATEGEKQGGGVKLRLQLCRLSNRVLKTFQRMPVAKLLPAPSSTLDEALQIAEDCVLEAHPGRAPLAEERRLNGLQVAASIAGDPGCERRLAAVLDLPDAAVAALLACAQHQALAETETFELQAEYDERGQERVFALVLDGALALRVQPAPAEVREMRRSVIAVRKRGGAGFLNRSIEKVRSLGDEAFGGDRLSEDAIEQHVVCSFGLGAVLPAPAQSMVLQAEASGAVVALVPAAGLDDGTLKALRRAHRSQNERIMLRATLASLA